MAMVGEVKDFTGISVWLLCAIFARDTLAYGEPSIGEFTDLIVGYLIKYNLNLFKDEIFFTKSKC